MVGFLLEKSKKKKKLYDKLVSHGTCYISNIIIHENVAIAILTSSFFMNVKLVCIFFPTNVG